MIHTPENSLFPGLPPSGPIHTPGAARAIQGNILQEVVCKLLGLRERPLVPGEWNPDGYDSVDYPYEIKSLREKNKAVVYKWRLERDLDRKSPPHYIFGIHRSSKPKSREEVLWNLAETMEQLVIIRAPRVLELAQDLALKVPKTEKKQGKIVGYHRKGYKDGYWNIPYDRIMRERCTSKFYQETIYALPFSVVVWTPWAPE